MKNYTIITLIACAVILSIGTSLVIYKGANNEDEISYSEVEEMVVFVGAELVEQKTAYVVSINGKRFFLTAEEIKAVYTKELAAHVVACQDTLDEVKSQLQ